jgi:hypothetical protein
MAVFSAAERPAAINESNDTAEHREVALRAELARSVEHLNDVRDELRRHVDTQERRAKLAEQERDDYRAARSRALVLHCWTNEDGKRFVFADELFEALEIPR